MWSGVYREDTIGTLGKRMTGTIIGRVAEALTCRTP
jgi:hypothetical protein